MSNLPHREDFLATRLVPHTQKRHDDCPICIGEEEQNDHFPLWRIAACQCRSVYHRECVETWLTERNTCPTCRRELFQKPSTVYDILINARRINQGFDIPVTAVWLTDSHLAHERFARIQEEYGQNRFGELDQDNAVFINANVLGVSIRNYGNILLARAIASGDPYNEADIEELTLLLSTLYRVIRELDGQTICFGNLMRIVYDEMIKRLVPFASSMDAQMRVEQMPAGQDFDDVTQYICRLAWALGRDMILEELEESEDAEMEAESEGS